MCMHSPVSGGIKAWKPPWKENFPIYPCTCRASLLYTALLLSAIEGINKPVFFLERLEIEHKSFMHVGPALHHWGTHKTSYSLNVPLQPPPWARRNPTAPMVLLDSWPSSLWIWGHLFLALEAFSALWSLLFSLSQEARDKTSDLLHWHALCPLARSIWWEFKEEVQGGESVDFRPSS